MHRTGEADVASTAEVRGRHRNRLRIAAYLLSVGWVALLLLGVAYGAMVQMLGSAYCEPVPGSSTYGELNWSMAPPGPTCTFTADIHGFDAVRGPYPVMSVWLAVLAVGGVLCVTLLRRSHSRAG
jgi:hypothetical protein